MGPEKGLLVYSTETFPACGDHDQMSGRIARLVSPFTYGICPKFDFREKRWKLFEFQ